MIRFSANTHIGQRKINEDKYFVDEELGLYIVADGVGGMEKGEVASVLTCQLIYKSIKLGMSLVAAVEATHQMILMELKKNNEKKGMASTVIAALFKDNAYEIAWVGDSRAYLWDGEFKLISRDHSYLELLYVNGHINIDEFKDHPNKNIISQALGIERKDISVATNKGTLEKDQLLLLMTDGLYEMVNEKNMIEEIKQHNDIDKLSDTLVKLAVAAGGRDNITLLTISSDEDSTNSENIIAAKVVRKFDTLTGQATECSDDIMHQTQSQLDKKPQVKVAKPKVLNIADTEQARTLGEYPLESENKILETILLSLIIIALLIIITFNM
jgi:protein phosphatase